MTELEHAAAEAWGLMLAPDTPLPPDLALDRVQDVCGERAEASAALHHAADLWLDEQKPGEHEWTGYLVVYVKITDHLNARDYDRAERARAALHTETHGVRVAHVVRQTLASRRRADDATAWGVWCVYAKRAIELCRAVGEAASPTQGVPT